jgi:hypothetical protein
MIRALVDAYAEKQEAKGCVRFRSGVAVIQNLPFIQKVLRTVQSPCGVWL